LFGCTSWLWEMVEKFSKDKDKDKETSAAV